MKTEREILSEIGRLREEGLGMLMQAWEAAKQGDLEAAAAYNNKSNNNLERLAALAWVLEFPPVTP